MQLSYWAKPSSVYEWLPPLLTLLHGMTGASPAAAAEAEAKA